MNSAGYVAVAIASGYIALATVGSITTEKIHASKSVALFSDSRGCQRVKFFLHDVRAKARSQHAAARLHGSI